MKKIFTLVLVTMLLSALNIQAQTAKEIITKSNNSIKTDAMEMLRPLIFTTKRAMCV